MYFVRPEIIIFGIVVVCYGVHSDRRKIGFERRRLEKVYRNERENLKEMKGLQKEKQER